MHNNSREHDALRIGVAAFFELLVEELKGEPRMQGYYQFLNGSQGRLYFRKNYFTRRLEYVARHIGPQGSSVWDCGCGFGSTALFLALNGYRVYGTTIETIHEEVLPRRLQYWAKYGDTSGFTLAQRNLWEADENRPAVDRIIVQDTLHHLEPIGDALIALRDALNPGGMIIAVEENGANLIARLNLFMRRGFKRIREIEDPRTGNPMLFGDENTRSFQVWTGLFKEAGLNVTDHEYIRYYLPFAWRKSKYARLREREERLWRRNALCREYGFFGLNMALEKRVE